MMFLRPILYRIYKRRPITNFCSVIENGKPSLFDTIRAISSVSSTKISPEKEYMISFLVNQCGLSSERAVSASKRGHFDSADKPNAVLNFLGKLGFSKSQISELVSRRPRLLNSKPEKTLLPKIEYISKLTGTSAKDTFRIVSRHPSFLTRSLETTVGPIYGYLKVVIGSEKANTLLRRGSWVFSVDLEKRMIPNVDFLRALGVPQSCIQLGLFNFPEIFSTDHVEFKEIVEDVKGMGFDLSKTMFILAIHVRTGKANASLWEQTYETYSKWGWSKDDIYTAFRKHPNCMLLSEKKISTVLNFVVNKIGLDSRLVAQCPYILFYNMEKRIIPRCSVVHLLYQKGLLKKDWRLGNILWSGEKQFLDKYVKKYAEEIPQLYEFYRGKANAVEG